jgi:hypothetical protein
MYVNSGAVYNIVLAGVVFLGTELAKFERQSCAPLFGSWLRGHATAYARRIGVQARAPSLAFGLSFGQVCSEPRGL